MPTITFTGIGLQVQSVTQLSGVSVRVRFTQAPLAVSPTGTHDALNPANYLLTGTGPYAISSIQVVASDNQSVDLFFTGLLAPGVWALAVNASVWAYDNSAIVSPRTGTFIVAALSIQEPVSMGAVDDDEEGLLRKHLNPALVGDAWDALIAAIATGDKKNNDNARLAFDQLFKTSASGIYLTRRAAADGLARPVNIGMPDSLFRQYSIASTNNKLVESSLLEILEVFYGTDTVRAHADSENAEPYALTDGDDLQILIDEQVSVSTVFTEADSAIISQSGAAEVAAALTRAFSANGSDAWAEVLIDPQTGSKKVRVYSPSLGLGSSIRVTGGKAQNVLVFDLQLPCFSGLPTWNITTLPATSTLRFSPTSACDVSQIQIGDYVNVFGSEFSAANRGTYTVTNVYWAFPGGTLTQYFDVINALGVAQGGLAQVAANDLTVFRPLRATIHSALARAVVVASLPDEIDMVLPATSAAVGRGKYRAAYGQVSPSIAVTSLERQGGIVSVTTATNHGLSIGSQIIVDGAYGAGVIPGTTTGSYTVGASSTSDRSKASIWSQTAGTTKPASAAAGVAVRLLDGRVFHGFGYNTTAGVLADTANRWCVLNLTAETTLTDGSKQLTFIDADASTDTVPQVVNFPGASVCTSSSWFAGQVIVTGGESNFSGTRAATNTIQQFTPDAGGGAMSALAYNMVAARAAHNQVTLAAPGTSYDGGIFVAGGMGSVYNRAIASTERFSLADEVATVPTWVAKAALSTPRAQAGAVVLGDGRVLVTGGRPMAQGHTIDSDTVACWRLDDALGTSADSGPNSLTLTDDAAVTQIVGESGKARKFQTAGGTHRTVHDSILATTFAGAYTVEGWFNTNNNAVTTGTIFSMGAALDGTANTNVQIAFGINTNSYYVWMHHGANVYAATMFTGSSVTATATYLWNHFAVVCDGALNYSLYINGKFISMVAASTAATGGSSTFWALGYDPSAAGGLFAGGGVDEVRISNRAHSAIEVYQGFQESTGELYYPDYTRVGKVHGSCEIYTPSTNTWASTGAMGTARFGHRTILLPDGRVLAVGGIGYAPSTPESLAGPVTAVEVWQPATGTWAPAGRLTYARDHVVAEYVASTNRVVVTGGSDANGVRTELFDPTRMTWSMSSAQLPGARPGAVSALAGTDVIALFGGYNATTGTSASFMELFIPNNDRFMGTGLNGPQTVATTPGPTTFTYLTNSKQYTLNAGGASITPFAAAASTTPGPFVYDLEQGIAVTSKSSTLTTAIAARQQIGHIDVVDATVFPDAPGYIALAFGTKGQVASVKYFGRLSNTRLSIDFSFKFPVAVAVGADVMLLAQKGPWVPDSPESVGSFYITDSPAGREAAEAAVEAAVAAGVPLNISVTYPGDRGLGGEGLPASGSYKVSDKVSVWGGSDVDAELATARGES